MLNRLFMVKSTYQRSGKVELLKRNMPKYMRKNAFARCLNGAKTCIICEPL